MNIAEYLRAVADAIDQRADDFEEVARLVTVLRDTLNQKLEEFQAYRMHGPPSPEEREP